LKFECSVAEEYPELALVLLLTLLTLPNRSLSLSFSLCFSPEQIKSSIHNKKYFFDEKGKLNGKENHCQIYF